MWFSKIVKDLKQAAYGEGIDFMCKIKENKNLEIV